MPTRFDSKFDRRSFVNAAGLASIAAFGSAIPAAAAELSAGEKDAVAIIGTLDIVFGEIDR